MAVSHASHVYSIKSHIKRVAYIPFDHILIVTLSFVVFVVIVSERYFSGRKTASIFSDYTAKSDRKTIR